MLGEDLKATLQTTNGEAGQHGKRNSHVSQTVSLISNMKEEAAMQSKIVCQVCQCSEMLSFSVQIRIV